MIICVISVICVLFLLERGWCGFDGFIRIRHFYANLRDSERVCPGHRITKKGQADFPGTLRDYLSHWQIEKKKLIRPSGCSTSYVNTLSYLLPDSCAYRRPKWIHHVSEKTHTECSVNYLKYGGLAKNQHAMILHWNRVYQQKWTAFRNSKNSCKVTIFICI